MGARIAMLGLGEAGSALPADLVGAGASVHGFDPAAPTPAPMAWSSRATPARPSRAASWF